MQRLSPETAAIYYDAIHHELTEDIPFLLAMLPPNGRVIELGSGSGRVLIPLNDAGLTVTGIDNDHAMLARAAAQLGKRPITLLNQNFIAFSLDTTFDAAIISHNTVMHTPETQLNKLFHTIASHLEENGSIIIDMVNPLQLTTVESSQQWEEERAFTAENGDEVVQFSRYEVDQRQQQIHVIWRYDVGDRRYTATTDYHFHLPHTLQLAMKKNNLIWEQTYGSYEKTPYDDESDLLLITARKRT